MSCRLWNINNTKKKNSDPLKMDKNIGQLKFKDFYINHTKYMRTITFDEFKLKFQNKQNP